jgi:hypothetical protein
MLAFNLRSTHIIETGWALGSRMLIVCFSQYFRGFCLEPPSTWEGYDAELFPQKHRDLFGNFR